MVGPAAPPLAPRRHTPERTCLACGAKGEKRQFLRLVLTPAGPVEIDRSGRAPGRGAYLCRRPACWTAALKGSRLSRVLRTAIPTPDLARLRDAAEPLPPPEEGVHDH